MGQQWTTHRNITLWNLFQSVFLLLLLKLEGKSPVLATSTFGEDMTSGFFLKPSFLCKIYLTNDKNLQCWYQCQDKPLYNTFRVYYFHVMIHFILNQTYKIGQMNQCSTTAVSLHCSNKSPLLWAHPLCMSSKLVWYKSYRMCMHFLCRMAEQRFPEALPVLW